MPTREHFDWELHKLRDDVLVLASMVDRSIDEAVEALVNLDTDAAQRVIAADAAIDAKRFRIEEQVVTTIATQQPLARDLRVILAILNIIIELERIGDYATGIAKIAVMHRGQPLVKRLNEIPHMANLTRAMLRRSLDAFVNCDATLAHQVSIEDDEIDVLHDQAYHELVLCMLRDHRTIDRATWLIWVSHNLERMADRVTNICERVVFLVTGRMEELNIPSR